MSRSGTAGYLSLLCAMMSNVASIFPALGQSTAESGATSTSGGDGPDTNREEIIVTGSYLKHPKGAAIGAPVDVYDSNYIQQLAATGQPIDFLKYIPQNVGNYSVGGGKATDAEGAFGAGTIDLRGLGAGATLVLLNGRRETPIPVDQDSRVDVNSLLPSIMLERVEVLKDGASALYGSDAVGGVVNFITKSTYEGAELKIGGQGATDTVDPFAYYNYTISGIFGTTTTDEKTHVVAAIEYYDQSQLRTGDVASYPWQKIPVTSFGFPGSFLVPRPSGSVVRMADPDCQRVHNANITQDPRFPTETGLSNPSTCALFQPINGFYPNEQRYNGRAEVSHDITDWLTIKGGFGYAHTDAQAEFEPTLPVLTPLIVPASNPGNPFGVPVTFLGRPYSTTNLAIPYTNRPTDVLRIDAELTGTLGALGKTGAEWSWDLAYGYSRYSALSHAWDSDYGNLQAAVNGHGGPCGCEYFNPFGNSLFAAPGSLQSNNPNLVPFIQVQLTNSYLTTLSTVDGVLTGDLFRLPGGPLGLALGFQHRAETLSEQFDPLDTLGQVSFSGNLDRSFSARQSTWAGFTEIRIPIFDLSLGRLEVSAAGRYEVQENRKGAFTPKVSALFDNDYISLSASWGTSNQAPSLFQVAGGTAQIQILHDPLTAPTPTATAQISTRTVGNTALENQEATTYNLQARIRPLRGLSIGVNYWNFDFSKLISSPSPAAILAGNPLDPRIVRNSNGTIQVINLPFFNVASLRSDGLDLTLDYTIATEDYGNFEATAEATFVNSYDIQQSSGGSVIHGVGSDNFTNIGQPMARWKGMLRLGWSYEESSVNLIFHDFSSVRSRLGGTFESQPTVDVSYSYELRNIGTRVTIGAINLLNNIPPVANLTGAASYLYTFQDVRGRILYTNLSLKF